MKTKTAITWIMLIQIFPKIKLIKCISHAVIAVTASLSLSALSNSSISNHSSGFMLLLEKVQSSKNAIKNMSNPHR
jgi:hypothetical protein